MDGIHYCLIRGFGDIVFAVSPMNPAPHYVHPLARTFSDFMRLLACGSCDALEQARPFFSEYEFASWYMSQPGTHSDDLEAIRMDYPAGHKAAIDLFISCVQPVILKML